MTFLFKIFTSNWVQCDRVLSLLPIYVTAEQLLFLTEACLLINSDLLYFTIAIHHEKFEMVIDKPR